MASFQHIQRCISMTDADVEEAVASRSAAKSLLHHMAEVAKPNEGAPKILLIFARMATAACDWLDGELRVELVGDGELCVVESMTELGGGLRERALPSFAVNVPLSEFVRSVERVPRMIEPLYVKTKSDRRLVLVASVERASRSLPPLPVAIAEEHLIELPHVALPKPPDVPPAKPPSPPRPAKAPVDAKERLRPPPLPPRPRGKGGE
jgi:hypothetical protein